MEVRSLRARAARGWVAASLLCCAPLACGPIDTGPGMTPSGQSGGGGGAGPGPGVAIVSPAPGQTCVPDKHQKSCPVTASVSGATLAEPGACGSAAAPCGHLELFVDGTACGNPNNESSSSSLPALLGRCDKVDGTHTLSCELRDDREQTLATSAPVTLQVQRHGDDGQGGD